MDFAVTIVQINDAPKLPTLEVQIAGIFLVIKARAPKIL
jgi:hypothetical protein